ncbi:MAG: phage holin family protein [Candidatus Roizmanbacteria bacterium]|nr:phage holin family protein [Candidatus Roizmanbacteria bacterium]
MLNLILNLVVATLAVLISDYLLPGVTINGLTTAVITAIVLGLLNTFVRPILQIIALPISILTLGLFALIINTAMVVAAGALVPGFVVESFLSAFFFSILLSIVSAVLNMLTGSK